VQPYLPGVGLGARRAAGPGGDADADAEPDADRDASAGGAAAFDPSRWVHVGTVSAATTIVVSTAWCMRARR
jgi:hypothetical protein